MNHDSHRLLSLVCAIALNTSLLCGGNGDANGTPQRTDSASRTESTSVTFSLSHQQAYDWQLGEVFHVDSRCTVRYRSVWNRTSMQVSAEVRGHVATLYTSHGPGIFGPVIRCTDGDITSQVKSVFLQGWIVDPYIRTSVSTPLTEIFPAPMHSMQRSAAWWDPVQSDQACGFHTRLFPASVHMMTVLFGTNYRQIRARYHTRSTDDPETVNAVESYRTSLGIECLMQADLLLDSSVRISNTCQTRTSAFRVSAVQCTLENEIRVKFWRYFGLTLCTNLRYDQSLSRKVLYKHVAHVGVIWEN